MEELITPRDINELANCFAAIDKQSMATCLRTIATIMVERKLPALTDKEVVGILSKVGVTVSPEDLLESIRLSKERSRETVKKQRLF